jgi:hypothetical protein
MVVRAGLVIAVLVAACAPARSTAVGRTGMTLALAGVVGILASTAASGHTDSADEMMVAGSAASATGIVLYAAHELSGPEVVYRQESTTQRHARWARILTEHAAGAARSGNCAPVRKFEPRVRVYDSNVHDFVFMRDPEILRCLVPTPGVRRGGPDASQSAGDE